MTFEEKQDEIDKKIEKVAKENGLIKVKPFLEPIYDGALSDYQNAKLKVLWVLKEPYESFTLKNKPQGGGWSMRDKEYSKDFWQNDTWKKIIYVMYGFLNNKKRNQMDHIKDNKEMADVINQIAFINISKMPGETSSNDKAIAEAYSIWRDVLLEQIKTYSPDVIIFGYTFFHFKKDLLGEDAEPIKVYDEDDKQSMTNVYKKGNVYYLDAYHPSRKGEKYVNTLIQILEDIKIGNLLKTNI